jgi:hypothetical protein
MSYLQAFRAVFVSKRENRQPRRASFFAFETPILLPTVAAPPANR